MCCVLIRISRQWTIILWTNEKKKTNPTEKKPMIECCAFGIRRKWNNQSYNQKKQKKESDNNTILALGMRLILFSRWWTLLLKKKWTPIEKKPSKEVIRWWIKQREKSIQSSWGSTRRKCSSHLTYKSTENEIRMIVMRWTMNMVLCFCAL